MHCVFQVICFNTSKTAIARQPLEEQFQDTINTHAMSRPLKWDKQGEKKFLLPVDGESCTFPSIPSWMFFPSVGILSFQLYPGYQISIIFNRTNVMYIYYYLCYMQELFTSSWQDFFMTDDGQTELIA